MKPNTKGGMTAKGQVESLAAVADLKAAFAFGHVLRPDGTVEPNRLTDELRISKQELAAAAGLSRDSYQRRRG